MPLQHIKVEVSDYVATVTMDRPPVNAQNAQFRAELMEVFDSFNDREDVRVAILTGAGKVFCAGADIKERASIIKTPGDYARHNRTAREYANSIRVCENMPQRDGYRFEQDITVQLSHTEDAKEAQRAFAEKRKPVFKGR